MVVDAGAFFRIKKLKIKRDNWILTPHPKEAANLLGVNLNHVQDKRLEKTKRLQEQYGGVVVLKGYQSIILEADDSVIIWFSRPANYPATDGDRNISYSNHHSSLL